MKFLLAAVFIGLAAGLLGALCGVGGGIVMVPAFVGLLGLEHKQAVATSMAVIIVTGAAVRLTGSGLGCDDWPRCSSTDLIDVSTGHAAIEQINRLFTGVVGFAVIAAVLASHRRRPKRPDRRWPLGRLKSCRARHRRAGRAAAP